MSAPTWCQEDASQPIQAPLPRIGQPQQRNNPEDEARIKMEKDMAKKANKERQEALKRDTDRLLQLSTELKQYVDKTNENMLSMDVIKKAEEIEKLAHSVREKMKGN
jgi:predicted  nucleic acid-binding Zn-ribbon protein